MKRQRLLLLWLLGILAPMAWLAHFIPGYNELFNFVFGPPWMHWLSHALLFAVLGFLLLSLSNTGRKITWSQVMLVFGIILVVAWLQESIQLWAKARAWGSDEWFDLRVDIAGATGGMILLAIRKKRERPKIVSTNRPDGE